MQTILLSDLKLAPMLAHTAHLVSINLPLAMVFLLDYYLDSPFYGSFIPKSSFTRQIVGRNLIVITKHRKRLNCFHL